MIATKFGRCAGILVLVLLSIATATPARASDAAATAGAQWLRGQVASDGTLGDESVSIATPAQQRAEALHAIALITEDAPAALVDRVADAADDDTEHLARAIPGLLLEQRPVAEARARLASAQNADGGFALAAGEGSTSLDTGLALAALGVDPGSDPVLAQRALGWLSAARDATGAHGVNRELRVYVTAHALIGAEAWKTRYDVAAFSQAATTWLLAQRASGHYATPLEDAVALLALMTRTNDAAILGPIADALRAAQAADRSWSQDPFVTALASRALWQLSRPPPAPTTGGVAGRVTNASNGLPVAGATIALVERNDLGATSRADGTFDVTAIPPGTYTLRVAAIGYATREATVTVAAGQILQVGTIALSPAPLTASLSGVVRTSTGTALADVLVAIGTISTTTNAQGQYLLTGISAGAATITVSKLNYRTLEVAQTFDAGRSYVFSPALYTTSQNPPTDATLRGRVLDAATNAAIAGAKLVVGAREATTGSDGRFTMSALPVGAFTGTLTAGTYQGATLSGILSAGTNDAGDIKLAKAPTSSTVGGVVSDVESGVPVAGAVVTVVGTGLSSTSSALGAYSIAGIANTSFQLQVVATGYATTRFDVSLPQHGTATLDLRIAAESTQTGITFREVRTSRPEYSPYDEFELEVEVHNATASPTELVIDAQVVDAQGAVAFELKANAKGAGQNPPNLPITIPANSLVEVELERILLRQPAGEYTVVARGADGGGRVVAQGTARFTVREEALLGGGVLVDPPLAQAGTGVPIQFDAELANLGNLPIDAGDYELAVTLDAADDDTSTTARTEAATLYSGTPLLRPQGAVADADGNVYVANNARIVKVKPDGTAEIAASVTGAGDLEDVARAADGTLWTAIADGSSRLWRIDPAGTRTEFRLASLQSTYSLALAANGDLLLAGIHSGETRLVRRTAAGTESILASNGLANPQGLVRLPSGELVVTNWNDNTLVKVRANGGIEPYLAGFNRPYGIALGADGSLYVANAGNHTIVRVAPDGTRTNHATGLGDPSDLTLDAAGNLYVANRQDHTIRRVPAGGGAPAIVARGIGATPYAVAEDAVGNLYVASDDGLLRRKAPDGTIDVLSTGLSAPRDVTVADSGDVYVANASSASVLRVSGGTAANFATGLATPFGLALGTDGQLRVTEQGAHRISVYAPDGALTERIESMIVSPQTLRHDAAGRLYVDNNGFISRRDGAEMAIHHRTRYTDFAPDAANPGGLVAISGTRVYRIDADGVARVVKTTTFGLSGGVAVLPDGSIVVGDTGTRRLRRIDAAGTVTEYAVLPTVPNEIVADGNGTIHVRSGNQLLRVGVDGTVTTVIASGYSLYRLSLSVDGRPILFAHQSNYRVLAVDPATGAVTALATSVPFFASGVAVDASGRITLSENGVHRLAELSGGSWQTANAGFFSPRDIVATGAGFHFTDQSYLYAYTPGSAPVRLGAFRTDSLTLRGTDLHGTNGATLVRWTGTASQNVTTIPGAGLRGLHARGDGTLTIADHSGARILVLNGANQVTSQFAGVVSPTGLAHDSDGRLHVVNSNGSIVRFDADDRAPSFVVRTQTGLRDLAFDAAGALHATRGGSVVRIDTATGAVTTVATDTAATLTGILADAQGTFALDSSRSQLRRVQGAQLAVVASGIATITSVREQGDAILVASHGNGTVSRYANGALEVLASGLVNPQGVQPLADGRFIVVGNNAAAYLVDADRQVETLGLGPILQNELLAGVVQRADGMFVISGYTRHRMIELEVLAPEPPPPVGTVVHRAVRSAPLLPVGEAMLSIDFGAWLPPYGGDFSVRVTRAGVQGQPMNFVHVGPFATGVFTAQVERVPPGDQTVPLRLRLEGADFTSVSRVETGQFRRLVNISFPKGMIADRSGNLYYTDNNSLRKVTPTGTATALVTGITPVFGLAIDSNENLYLPVLSGGQYRVMRVALDGTQSIVANLGSTQTNGIAVNSRDEILVGRFGALLRVDPGTGAVSTVGTTGIEQPRGIAVDARDNVYVMNANHHISQIRPDGTARTIFAGANGQDQPSFEGDGYPTITADCADNFYITAFTWARVGQSGEERVLSQVVPRTGQVVGLLDVSRVDPRVGDIDYLSFDRFGNRILMWDHNTSAIYQVPVTCGAIGVEAHVLTEPGQTLTGFDRAPAAALALADGRTEYVWSLADVTAEGEAINFDTELLGLTLGETRKVANDAFIVFRNSFAPNDVRVRIAVPSVAVDDMVSLEVVTDRAEYPARATARITTTLRNTNPDPVSGELRVTVHDAAGSLVGTLPPRVVALPAGDELAVEGDFSIGTILPADYTVVASLHDLAGEQAHDDTRFRVLADEAEGSARAELQLDRAVYAPSDRVQITSRAVSTSANVMLENLVLTVQVRDPAGATLATQTHAIAQLLPSSTRTFAGEYLLANAQAGDYSVHQTLADEQGRVLDTDTATFAVASSTDTGQGLSGTIAATPAAVEVGTPVELSAIVVNGGNADYTGLPVRVALLDLENEAVLASFPSTIDLPQASQHPLAHTWPTAGVAPGDYTAALIATVGDRELTLATTPVAVRAISIRVDVTQRVEPTGRVLVLLDCDRAGGDNGGGNLSCADTAFRDFVSGYLATHGIAHTIVTDATAFRGELRTGRYDVYWLSGVAKLGSGTATGGAAGGGPDANLAAELRESVFRGDGLFVDGSHDSRNAVLEAVLGVSARGRLSERDPSVTIAANDVFGAQTLQTAGTGLRFDAEGAVVHGRFGDSATSGDPAVFAHRHGAGRTVLMAFDFASMLKAAPTSAAQLDVLNRTLRHVTPPVRTSFGPGSFVPLTTTLTNRGVAVDLEVTITAPAGVTIESADPAASALTPDTLVWRLRLEAGATRDLDAGLRIGDASGVAVLETRVVAVVGGVSTPLSTHAYPLTLVALADRAAAAKEAIEALVLTASQEVEARDQALAQLARAGTALGEHRYEDAVRELLDARDRIVRITSVDVTAARAALAELIRIAAHRANAAPPAP